MMLIITAPAILRMLQHTITPEVFRNGIIRYLHKHQFSSVSSDDLWNALQAALDESDVLHNAYRLKQVMDTWFKQRHYPEVRVTRNYDTGETILTQEHFRPKYENEHIDSDKWWIPLTFATQTNLEFSNTLPIHWLRPQDKNISIDGVDPNDWIIVNVQQMGYYRVNYDNSNWQKIADYLNSDNYTKIHVLNRAQIIDDAYHLMSANQLDIQMFLNLANYLSRETDYVGLYPMFTILDIREEFFKIPETVYFKQFVLRILDELIKNVGYEEDSIEDDITKIKRSEILKWACDFGHSECKRMATVKLNEFLENPETYRIPSNLKEWTYCNGLMKANASTWNKLLDIGLIKQDISIIEYLTCSENPDILINFMNKSVSNDLKLPGNNNYRHIMSIIVQRHSDNDVVLDYMLANLEEITPRELQEYKVIFGIIISVHNRERLDKINDFVKSKFNETTYKYIQEVIEDQKSELTDVINDILPFIY